jgi:DNA-binding PadR family transcriptional regulator
MPNVITLNKVIDMKCFCQSRRFRQREYEQVVIRMARPVSNPLALAVLSCLWERPMYPYEITTTLRERGKEESIRLNFGSLYAVIKSLQKHGLIETDRVEKEGNRPERIVYAITDAGRTEAISWLRELLEVPQKEYPAFEAGLSLIAMLRPDEALDVLRRRIERLDDLIGARQDELRAPDVESVPEIFLIETQYLIEMLQAERRWIGRLLERLDAGEVGGQHLWKQMHDLIASGIATEELQERYLRAFAEGAEPPPNNQ